MNCQDVREQLEEILRGDFPAGSAEALQVHLAGCAACRETLEDQRAVRAVVRAEAPRYVAPPGLRARIEARLGTPMERPRTASPAWWSWTRSPRWGLVAAAGTLVVLLAVWAPSLWTARDPVARLMAAGLAEYQEYARRAAPRPATDPALLLAPLRSQIDFPFEPIFLGDPEVHLVSAQVSELAGRRAATLVYRDAAGRYATLFLMPGMGIAIPEQGRMPIETYAPYHRVTDGKQVFLWKQRNLTCLLVIDGSRADGAALFLKIRRTA
jgi:anti-sigma factor (TIGR02949 family)